MIEIMEEKLDQLDQISRMVVKGSRLPTLEDFDGELAIHARTLTCLYYVKKGEYQLADDEFFAAIKLEDHKYKIELDELPWEWENKELNIDISNRHWLFDQLCPYLLSLPVDTQYDQLITQLRFNHAINLLREGKWQEAYGAFYSTYLNMPLLHDEINDLGKREIEYCQIFTPGIVNFYMANLELWKKNDKKAISLFRDAIGQLEKSGSLHDLINVKTNLMAMINSLFDIYQARNMMEEIIGLISQNRLDESNILEVVQNNFIRSSLQLGKYREAYTHSEQFLADKHSKELTPIVLMYQMKSAFYLGLPTLKYIEELRKHKIEDPFLRMEILINQVLILDRQANLELASQVIEQMEHINNEHPDDSDLNKFILWAKFDYSFFTRWPLNDLITQVCQLFDSFANSIELLNLLMYLDLNDDYDIFSTLDKKGVFNPLTNYFDRTTIDLYLYLKFRSEDNIKKLKSSLWDCGDELLKNEVKRLMEAENKSVLEHAKRVFSQVFYTEGLT